MNETAMWILWLASTIAGTAFGLWLALPLFQGDYYDQPAAPKDEEKTEQLPSINDRYSIFIDRHPGLLRIPEQHQPVRLHTDKPEHAERRSNHARP